MKVWQLLVLELARLVKLLTHQKFEVGAVHGLVIPFVKMSDKCGIDHLLLSCGLCADELDECGPDLVNVAELLFDLARVVCLGVGMGLLGILLCNDLSDIEFTHVLAA